ncbi:MAG TPA: hypothetical protein VM432_12390 [Bdellovibrionales bacterium]|nr:hypothetical protein [Bdellovibrionales bacterium]
MNLRSIVVCILTWLFCSIANAGEFTPDVWTEGLHLFAGGSGNCAILYSDEKSNDVGMGVGLRTDASYFLSNYYALEFGANVAFYRIEDFTLWDTLVTLGLRARLPWSKYSKDSAPFFRVFGGRSPTVVVFREHVPLKYADNGIQRLQFEGPIAGVGIGLFKRAASGQVWYLELSLSAHFFENQDDIRSDGETPVVVEARSNTEYDRLQTLQFALGLVAF